ncbi:MAG: hypothetical protein ACI9LV_000096 [Candidatus Nanohaloarchaea archaeon]
MGSESLVGVWKDKDSKMELNDEILTIYFGALNEPKNLSEIAEDLYGEEKKDSVRTIYSRSKALQQMLDHEYLSAEKDGNWKYQSNKDKLLEVITHLFKYEDKNQEALRVEAEDEETIENIFGRSEVLRLFENERLQKVLGEKVSDAEKQLSMYVKILYMSLAGARIVVEDLDFKEGQNVRVREEGLENLKQMTRLINFASRESPLRIGPIFQIIIEEVPQIDLMDIPRTESPQIKSYASMATKFIENMMNKDIGDMVEAQESSLGAA